MVSSSGMVRCSAACFDDPGSLLSIESILHCQKISDFLIALAYFSIPMELLYFATCATILPFRWILLQFGAFIVLCGLSHLLSAFTYGPHSFVLVLSVTLLKALTALVSIATAITLVTLLPNLLRLLVRDGLLRRKTQELHVEVGLMKQQEAAGWHVRMLTAEIRRSLDRHTILHTTLVELSNSLLLLHCSVWMPSPTPARLVLTHEFNRRDLAHRRELSVPTTDPDVTHVVEAPGVVVLPPDSKLVDLPQAAGPAVAIRLPLLRAASFKAGTPELLDAAYAILVLVLPEDRAWANDELELVGVVGDQVAVALSHAAVLEDSLAVREQLMERNAMLERERQVAEMANAARVRFRNVLTREISAPLRSAEACLSALLLDDLAAGQLAAVKAGSVLASIVGCAADPSRMEGRGQPCARVFVLRGMAAEAARVCRLLCSLRGVRFELRVVEGLPKCVVGDERRVMELLVCMVGSALGCRSYHEGGVVVLGVGMAGGSGGTWKANVFDEDHARLRFKVGGGEDGEAAAVAEHEEQAVDGEGLFYGICQKLAEVMQGRLSITATSKEGSKRSMNLLIRLQKVQTAEGEAVRPNLAGQEVAFTLLKGMRVLLADGDGFSRNVSRKALERTGCQLTTVASWAQCLDALQPRTGNRPHHLLLLDIRLLGEGSADACGARLRKLRSQGWLMVVALDGSCRKETRERCGKMGIHGVIRTPVVIQEMVEELQRISQQLQAAPALVQSLL